MRTKVGHFMRFLALAVCSAAFNVHPAHAQSRQTVQTVSAAPASAHSIAPLRDAKPLRLALSLPLRNQQQLQTLIQQLNDPASPNYHKFLTVGQFTAQFGPTAADYAKVLSFANSHGFKVTRTFPNRLVVNVTGSASTINQAFHVTLGTYQHPTEHRSFYAPDVEPTVETGVPI